MEASATKIIISGIPMYAKNIEITTNTDKKTHQILFDAEITNGDNVHIAKVTIPKVMFDISSFYMDKSPTIPDFTMLPTDDGKTLWQLEMKEAEYE